MSTPSTTKTDAPSIQPGAYKIKAAAQYCGGVSEISIRRAVDRGLLKPNRSFRHLLFPKAELDRFLSEN